MQWALAGGRTLHSDHSSHPRQAQFAIVTEKKRYFPGPNTSIPQPSAAAGNSKIQIPIQAVVLCKDVFASPLPSTIGLHLHPSEVFCYLPASFRGPWKVPPEPPDPFFCVFSLPTGILRVQWLQSAHSRHCVRSLFPALCARPLSSGTLKP